MKCFNASERCKPCDDKKEKDRSVWNVMKESEKKKQEKKNKQFRSLQLNTASCDACREMMPGDRDAAKSLVLSTEEKKNTQKREENLVGCHAIHTYI